MYPIPMHSHPKQKKSPNYKNISPKFLALCFDNHKMLHVDILRIDRFPQVFPPNTIKPLASKIFVRAERRTLGSKEGLGFFPPSFRSKPPFEMCGIGLIISGVPIDSSSLLPESGSDGQPLSSPAPESKRVRFQLFSH